MGWKCLPCKILNCLNNEFYELGCAIGHLKINYRVTVLYSVVKGAYFPELDNIPQKGHSSKGCIITE